MPPHHPTPPDHAIHEADRLVDDVRDLWSRLDRLLDRVERQRDLATRGWASDRQGEIPDDVAEVLAPREVDVTLAAMLARLAEVAPEPGSITADELTSFGLDVPGYGDWVVEHVSTLLEGLAATSHSPAVRAQLRRSIEQVRRAHLPD